jgi:hypothetical protein
MKVLKSYEADEIQQTPMESVNSKSFVFTDNSTSNVSMSDYIEGHLSEKSSREITIGTLKWVHIAISNMTVDSIIDLKNNKKASE